jgi:hypothetical protein
MPARARWTFVDRSWAAARRRPAPPGGAEPGPEGRPARRPSQSQTATAADPAVRVRPGSHRSCSSYGWLPGPPWLWHELGRSAFGPVHWPDLPAPLPPLVGGEGLAYPGAAAASANAPARTAAAAFRRISHLPRCLGSAKIRPLLGAFRGFSRRPLQLDECSKRSAPDEETGSRRGLEAQNPNRYKRSREVLQRTAQGPCRSLAPGRSPVPTHGRF